MAIQVSGSVGEHAYADGSSPPVRQGSTGEQAVADLHGRYYESALRNKTFAGGTSSSGVTVAAGMLSPLPAGGTPFLSLYNPLGSNVGLEILKVVFCYRSGTPANGAWALNLAFGQSITATGVSGINSFTGSYSVGKLYANTAITGSSASTYYRTNHFSINTINSAMTSTNTPQPTFVDVVDGEIILVPGGLMTLCPPDIGTALIASASILWAEVPL